MKKIIVSMMAAAGLMIAGSAAADTPMPTDLISAGKFACTGCHKVDSKLVGPAWRDVSKFYNGKTAATSEGVSLKDATGGKSAKDYLIEKVSKGGKGHWGKTPMSPNDPSGAKKAEVAALVDWILALEK